MTPPTDSEPTTGRYRRRTFLASLVAGGSLALAGCGSSGDDGSSGTTDGPTDAGTPGGTATRTPDGTATPEETATPTATATPDPTTTTPAERVAAECSVSSTEVAVGEAVTIDAADGEGDRAQFFLDGDDDPDATDSDDLSISVEFDEPGTVAPRVTVEGEGGTDSATCSEITVTEAGPPEIDCEVSPTEASVGDPVVVDATGTEGAKQLLIDPTGDGEFVPTATNVEFVHNYAEPGEYTPRVDVPDDRVDPVECATVTVTEGGAPQIDCEVTPTETTAGDPVTIDATGTEGATELLIDPTGDGEFVSTATNVTFVHNYESPGEYTPRVDVPDERAGPVECATVTVDEAPQPTARCSLSTTEATVGDEVRIDAGESDASQVFFDVDGDGEFELVDGEDLAATFTVTSAGEVTPRIRAETRAGEDVAECETITVTDDEEAIAVVDLPVTATYLRTNNDGAGDTTPIALSEYDISPGDRITLSRVGEFYRGSPFGTAGKGMIGVFSGSATLESGGLHRVPDAIDAGPAIRTSNTYYGGLPTNVLEDFSIATNDGDRRSATVEVPEGATHLFVAAKDNLYDDNEPVTDRYAVKIADGSGQELTADVDPEESVAFGDRIEEAPEPDVEVDLDPSATYLHTNGEDVPDAEPIDLEQLGVSAGDEITLVRLGSFTSGGGYGLLAVFSFSSTLLPADRRYRVQGAVDAGVDHETSATYWGSEATDVPEDFLVADHDRTVRSVSVTVPSGARYLFAAAKDNLYNDNGDDGFGVGIVLP